jgi:CubicO group peptidase (beta-lactamase class C family)
MTVRRFLPRGQRDLFLLAIFSGFSLACLPPSAQTLPGEVTSRLDSIARSPVDAGTVAGLAVVVVRGPDTLLMKGYGTTNIDGGSRITEHSVFQIGSVTKQFTAAAILKLRDAKKIDLDADLTEYLPEYPTLRGLSEIRRRRFPRDSVVALFGAEPLLVPPGTAMNYSNSGYFLLGLIVERISGISYEDYIEQEFFFELGMDRTGYCSNTESGRGKALGHRVSDGRLSRTSPTDHTYPYAAGSVCASAGDLILWLDALHGGAVLPEHSYQDMTTPRPLIDGFPLRYAMGFLRTEDSEGRTVLHHHGGIRGFEADTRYYPEEDLSIVVLINTFGSQSPTALSEELADVVLPPLPERNDRFEGDPTPFLGRYGGPTRGGILTVTITVTGDGLTATIDATRRTTLGPLAWIEDQTFGAGPYLLTFGGARDDGSATVLRLDHGTGHYVLERQSR